MRFTFPAASPWIPIRDGDPEGLALYERHYSAHRYRDGRVRRLFGGPGEQVVLITPRADALFVWRCFRSMDPLARGANCSVFRNEGAYRSSALILDAEQFARARWPDVDTVYTYVDGRAVRISNPGYCFLMAGWRRTRRTKDRGLWVLEKRL